MQTQRQLVALPDGRDIEIMMAGPPDGLPLIIHDGTPVGLEIYPPTARAARARGLRVIQVARPGYERSTPRPGRRVADIAADVAVVLDSLGADTFLSAGWSGGGPHSLACAALLPGRCLGAASIAGVAPHDAEGLDWSAGMAPENVAEFGAAARGAGPLTEFLDTAAAELAGVTGEQVAAALGGLVSSADNAALTGEYADTLAAGLRAAVKNGIAGWRDDDLAFVAGWGFGLGWESAAADAGAGLGAGTGDPDPGNQPGEQPSRTPVAIWQGDCDRMVPFAHGQWLARHIPGARTHLLPGEGHLTLTVSAIDQILDDLLDAAPSA